MSYRTPFIVFSLLLATIAFAEVKHMNIEYNLDGTRLEGYVAWDDAAKGERPGILVIHEWWGLNDFAKQKADELAKLGYVALACDMYGVGIRPKTPDEAGKAAGVLRSDRALMRARANAALVTLKKQPNVDPKKCAAIGFCFGGGAALELARSGAELSGAVSFHGNLDTPNPLDANLIKAKLLVLHGADDAFINPQVPAFRKEMTDAKIDWQFVEYSGAVHAFMNPNAGNDPSKGAAYHPVAARRAWKAMQDFFAEIFAN